MLNRVWRPLRRRAATSPGQLTFALVAVVALSLAFGLVGALTMRDSVTLVRDVSVRSGPLTVQAQDIYRSLSDADATAASAFLANGVEPAALRTRYLDDITHATTTVAAALRSAEGDSAAALDVLVVQVPVYTGLVEAARTYNRQGLPLGGAYLREASALMRQTILPAAQELYRAESQRLTRAQSAVSRVPWAAALLGLALLGLLMVTQVRLRRMTNRVLNRGLLAATLASVVAFGWMAIAVTGAATRINNGAQEGSLQVGILAEARITALQARADEGLTLIARGDGAQFEQDFTVMMERLVGADGTGGLLERANRQASDEAARSTVEEARSHARAWLTTHRKVRELDDSSQHLEAVRLATGTGPDSAANAAGQLDAALARGITDGRQHFDRQAETASNILRGADLAVALLAVLLAAAGSFGLYQRIAEYR
ncbi:hypothetical protein ACIBF5_31955 [Micromonospora sp. NPDC050417]|uniref:hypothetical protein n=1 Tax=Micromonospora sp. NPDC050417 TaxID=3364280 RepID=UPI0037BDED27